MDLYENTLIGSFLYGLGVEIGARTTTKPLVASVDLLQQTPVDKSLADVLILAPRLFRLFEFKRTQNESSKERKKQEGLISFFQGHPSRDELLRTSRAIHHYVQIGYEGELPDGSPALSIGPYLGGRLMDTTLPLLCEETAAHMIAPSPSPSPEACARYLSVLLKTQTPLKRGSGGGSTLMVAMRHGLVEQAHVPDLRDFARRGKELAARQQMLNQALAVIRQREHDAALKQLRERAAERERKADRDYQFGD